MENIYLNDRHEWSSGTTRWKVTAQTAPSGERNVMKAERNLSGCVTAVLLICRFQFSFSTEDI